MTNDMQQPPVDSDDPAETETPARVRTRRPPRSGALAVDAPATDVDAALPEPETDDSQDQGKPEVRRRTRPSGARRRTSAAPPSTADDQPTGEPALAMAAYEDPSLTVADEPAVDMAPPKDGPLAPAAEHPAEVVANDGEPAAVQGDQELLAVALADEEVAGAVLGDDEPVTVALADEPVTVAPADEGVTVALADEPVTVAPADEPVTVALADEELSAVVADDEGVASAAPGDGPATGAVSDEELFAVALADEGVAGALLGDDEPATAASADEELAVADLGDDQGRSGGLLDDPAGAVPADGWPVATPEEDGVVEGEVLVGDVEVPGALDEPELEVEAEPVGAAEPALLVRRRRRRRAEGADASAPELTEPPLLDTGDQAPAAGDQAPAAESQVLDRAVEAVDARDRAEVGAGETADSATDGDGGANAKADDGAEADGEADAVEGEGAQRSRRRRRGGRGRGRRGGSRSTATDETGPEATDEDTEQATADQERGSGPGRRGKARAATDADADADAATGALTDTGIEPTAAHDDDSDTRGAPSTRLAARGRGRGRARPGERPGPGGGARGRRPAGTVSEETRRAIAEAPPKKMLVSVGEKRTQVVVLEERNLVEHYVTRREDVSYVGNIYVGRVQNVLPGMEAAFVDIGKGRNGVLYSGEVNYDEADLEGELPRIEQTLKPGQTVLVQVTKDPMGTKGARLTQQLSIAGRYCVLAPNDGMLGISRKLPEDERERLRKILKTIKPEDYGLIVRTAAEGATREQLEDDVARLVRIWEGVVSRVEQAEPLQAVYEEPELVIRVIRDVFGPDYRELVVDDEVLGNQIRGYLADVSPELVDKVSVYAGEAALFNGYEVTNQIRRALEKKVWLASGGYLIVEKTEAMWVIDVNTGKFVGKSNLEETVLKNNLEAAAEIARQLRLRDMGGIIVIDFVDMLVPANRDEVLKRFKRELARDKTKSRVMEISKLGLVQMTRKNVSQGLNESFTTVCECCDGRGAQIVESMLG